jgi:hypothetical protein
MSLARHFALTAQLAKRRWTPRQFVLIVNMAATLLRQGSVNAYSAELVRSRTCEDCLFARFFFFSILLGFFISSSSSVNGVVFSLALPEKSRPNWVLSIVPIAPQACTLQVLRPSLVLTAVSDILQTHLAHLNASLVLYAIFLLFPTRLCFV